VIAVHKSGGDLNDGDLPIKKPAKSACQNVETK
jgi:hypothetical protein